MNKTARVWYIQRHLVDLWLTIFAESSTFPTAKHIFIHLLKYLIEIPTVFKVPSIPEEVKTNQMKIHQTWDKILLQLEGHKQALAECLYRTSITSSTK